MSAYCQGVRFGKVGYSCVLSPDLRVLNSDNDAVFKHLCRKRGVVAAAKTGKAISGSFEHRFTYEKVRFRAVFTPINNDYFLGRCYPEDLYLKNSCSEIYNCIYKIRHESMSMISGLRYMLDDMLKGELPKKYIDTAAEQIAAAERILSGSTDIMELYDNTGCGEYVLIRDMLKCTAERVVSYCGMAGRDIRVSADIECGVAQINYMIFEAAVFEIAGILCGLIRKGEGSVISIKGRRYEPMVISASVDYDGNADERELERAVRLVKCSFECIGGKSYLYVCGGKFVIDVSLPVALSEHYERVAENAEDKAAREPRGIDKILSSETPEELVFRSNSKQYKVSNSMLIANIIFEPICRRLIS